MADPKDIVLRISAITDKEVMEEFGEVLNNVLGSYEDNIRLLGEYNSQIKQTQAEIARLKKIEEERGKLNEAQKQQLANLTAEERKLRQASSELQQTLKNEEKIRTTANGTMVNQAQLLGKLRMAWRQMTDEQKAANPQMLAAIQALDRHIKGADANIGNFQRNVGNYPGLMAQMGQSVVSMAASVNPAFGTVTQTVMGMTEQFGLTSGAIGAIGGVLAVAAAGFKVFQDSMELTQTVGDAVAIKVAGWEAVYDRFIRMIVSADFSNFWEQLSMAKEAAENLTAALDEMFERENALTIAEAKLSEEQETNLTITRDMTKSYEERKKAGESYIRAAQEMADRRKAIAEQEYKARLADFAAQTGLEEQQVKNFIENYETYRDIANEYAALQQEVSAEQKYISTLNRIGGATDEDFNKLQEARNKLTNFYNSLTDAQREFLESQKKYNDGSNDEMTEKLVAAWTKTLTATSEALKATRRASTTVSSITAQQQKEAERQKQEQKRKEEQAERERLQKERAKVNTSTQIIEQFGAETDALIDEFLGTKFDQYRERVNEEMAQMVTNALDDLDAMEQELDNSLSQAATTLQPIKQSPLAVALGVTDEQLTSIKSQALQAAQQIYGSIQQMAQQASQRRLDNELKAVETEAEREKAILKAKLDSGVLNEKQYEKKIAEIDKNAEAKREEAQKEAFEREKRWNIANALMNMALAITNIWATNKGGAAARIAETVIATASGLAQIATISAQKYARGGELHGASHAQGGIKGNIQGHNIELEGDEVVINKRSSRKYRSLLSYINSDNGWGVDFAGVRGSGGYRPQLKYAKGGVLGSYDFSPASVPQASLLQKQMAQQVERTESLIAATNRRIDRLQVQVNISDIEGASNTKRVHINRAKL